MLYSHCNKTPKLLEMQRYNRPGNFVHRLKHPKSNYYYKFPISARKNPKPGNYSTLIAILLSPAFSFAAFQHHLVLKH